MPKVDFILSNSNPNNGSPSAAIEVKTTEGLCEAIRTNLEKHHPHLQRLHVYDTTTTEGCDMTVLISGEGVQTITIVDEVIKTMKNHKATENSKPHPADPLADPRFHVKLNLDDFEEAVKAWTSKGIIDGPQLQVLLLGFQAIHMLTRRVPEYKVVEKASIREFMQLENILAARARDKTE